MTTISDLKCIGKMVNRYTEPPQYSTVYLPMTKKSITEKRILKDVTKSSKNVDMVISMINYHRLHPLF